jgi:crotonobetainyl-CoA:carnitine CoA-transferase CaiB-like acyl-CoA transferase
MGSLDGVRVVELTTVITGPLAGMMLADLGADVVKIEPPGSGDPFRSFRTGTYSPPFCAYNRNKRSVMLDLRSDHGRAALTALIKRSDVLLENFRPGVLERLGFGDEHLATLNPRLIHCSITGFGSTGPYAKRPAYDAVSQSLGGMAGLFLDPHKPQMTGPTVSDNATGYSACYGILAALYERERTGKARRVDVNMLDATIAFMPDPFGYYNQMDLKPDPYTRVRSSQSFAFRCKDDTLICIHLSSLTKFWDEFIDAVGLSHLRDDPRFVDRPHRIDHYFEIGEAAAPVFLTRTRDEWLAHLEKRDLPFAPIYRIEEVMEDPQVVHNGTFFVMNHSTEGKVTAVRRPVWFDGSRLDQGDRPPPTLGEHTEEVLRELGLDGGVPDYSKQFSKTR